MKERREAMGLSLRDAARLSGVSHTHIRDIEDGRSIPSFEMVMKFLKAYTVEIGVVALAHLTYDNNLIDSRDTEIVALIA